MKMKKHLLLTAAIGLTASAVFLTSTPAHAAIQFYSQPFILTASTSPSNNICLQNVMGYLEKKFTGVGLYVPYNSRSNDPTTVNSPGVLRACQLNYSALASFYQWDSTNNPTGKFAFQNGSRLGWGLIAVDYEDTFLGSQLNFRSSSSDLQNSLGYAGNLATNTTDNVTPLTFSTLFRGYVLGSNGVPTAVYVNGESVAGHPVNLVIDLIRIGYRVNDINEVNLNLNYFKIHMQITNFMAFYAKDLSGNVIGGYTNQLSSRVHANPAVQVNKTLGTATVDVEGQRQLGLVYGLERRVEIVSTNQWVVVADSVPEGFVTDTNVFSEAGFRGYEKLPPSGSSLAAAFGPQYKPARQGNNGAE